MLTGKIRRLVASSVPGLVDADPRQISISFVRLVRPDASEDSVGAVTDEARAGAAGSSATSASAEGRQLFGGWPYVFGIVCALMICGFIMRKQFMPPADASDDFETSEY